MLALLEEPEPTIKVFALKKLNTIVDTFWPEISESIDKMLVCYEDNVWFGIAAVQGSQACCISTFH